MPQPRITRTDELLAHVQGVTVTGMHATDGDQDGVPAIKLDRVAYTLQDAARLLSLSYRKVRYMADSGELPVFKIGRSRRVHGKDIEEYVARQQRLRQQEKAAS